MSGVILASQTPGTAAPILGPFDSWEINSSGAATKNGVVVTGATSGVLILAYHNHFVYQLEMTTNTGQGTYATPGVGQFVDGSGNIWSIDTNGNVLENGTAIPGGDGTGAIDLYNGQVYAEDGASGNWFTWNGSSFDSATAPGNLPGSGTGSGTYATPGSGSFTDSSGNVWSIDTSGNVVENGNDVPGAGGTGAIDLYNGVVYAQDSSSGNWFSWDGANFNAATAPGNLPGSGGTGGTPGWSFWNGTTWVSTAPPLNETTDGTFCVYALSQTGITQGPAPTVTLNSITLSNTNFTANVAGASIGSLTVNTTPVGAFTGILSHTNSAQFTLTGTTLTTAVALAVGTYTDTITATLQGATNSPLSSTLNTLTAQATITLSVINLSATSFNANQSGATVGTISVTTSPTGSFTGTLNHTNTAQFTLSGTTLTTASALLPGTYSDTVTATQAGAVGSPLTHTFSSMIAQAAGASASGTTIPSASQIIDNSGGIWTVVGGVILLNGAAAGTSSSVTLLLWYNNVMYQQVVDSDFPTPGNWWTWDGTNWDDFGTVDPRPPGPSLSVSTVNTQIINQTFVVSGTLTNYTVAPTTLQYADNSGSFTNIPSPIVTATTFSFTHPLVAAASSSFVIHIQDSANTATATGSVTLVIENPASVTLTSITLPTTTFAANSAVGTVVSPITVATTGGTFVPDLSGGLTLSGTNANLFGVSGTNLTLANATIGAGTYSFNIIGKMTGASGSPLTSAKSVTASAGATIVGGTAVAKGIAVQTSTVSTISPYLWGVGTEGGDFAGSSNDFLPFLNSNFQAKYRQLGFRLFRNNATGSTPSWTAAANGTDTSGTVNYFTGSSAYWVQGTGPTDTTPGHMLNAFTLGGSETNYAATASDCTAIANLFKSKGVECFIWQIYNEPGITASAWISNFNTCYTALKKINPNYWVGGPVYADAGDASSNGFLSALASNSNKPDFIDWHCYLTGGYTVNDAASMLAKTVTRQNSDLQVIAQFFPSSQLFMSEYNIDYNGTEPMLATSDGALFVSLYTGLALKSAGSRAWGSAIWEQDQNNNFKIVSNDGNTIYPQGYVLGKLGRTMPGTQHTVTLGSGLPANFLVFASVPYGTSTNWSVWITNYDTSAVASSFTVQGLTGSTFNYWEMSPANSNPPLYASHPIANLTDGSLNIPARSVVVLSSNDTGV
jgi:hypothetical protein